MHLNYLNKKITKKIGKKHRYKTYGKQADKNWDTKSSRQRVKSRYFANSKTMLLFSNKAVQHMSG